MLDQGQKSANTEPPRGPERLGRYELVAHLGDGAMAEVHLARRLGAPDPYAPVAVVKKIHARLARHQAFVSALLDEARLAALVKHPSVVTIYDVGLSRGVYFIAMEYLAGQSLQVLLARRALHAHVAARVVADVAEALHATHELRTLTGRPRALVHRDVTPKNIVVLHDGSVKLVDIGIARAWAHLPEPGRASGYLAPEQASGEAVDRRADIFALGVVMWEALAGRRLFDADSAAGRREQLVRGALPPSAHRPVPPELDEVCERALAPAPADRFQSAGEMQAAIESFLGAVGFRRDDGALAATMAEAFAGEREAQEALLRLAVEPAPVPPSELLPFLLGDDNEGDTNVKTVVRSSTHPGAPVARGSQHIRIPIEAEGTGAQPLVPMPGPLPGRRKPAAPPARAAGRSPDRGAGAATGYAPGSATGSGSGSATGSASGSATDRVSGSATDRVSGSASDRVSGSASDRVSGSASDRVSGSVSDRVSGSASGSARVSGPVSEPVFGSATGSVSGSASVAGSATGSASGSATGSASGSVSGSDPVSASALGGADGRLSGGVVETASEAALDSGPTDATGTGPMRDASGSSAAGRPRGKGRTGRIESIADAWSDRLRHASSRALPLPAPPKQADSAAGDAAGDADEEDDDFTIVDPEKTPRSFESTPAPVPVAASEQPSAPAARTDPPASASVVAPILPGRRPRRLWLVGLAGAGAAALLVALVLATPGRDPAPAQRKAALAPRQPAPRAASVLSVAKLAESDSRPTAKPQPAPRPAAKRRHAASASRSGSRAAERAKPAARKAARRGSASPDDLYRDGARLYLDGKLDQARRKFQAALALAPRFAPGHRGLGLVYERMGQTDRAIRSWQAYLRISPEADDAKIIRARLRRLSK
jgi:eukaryotic-like serine/threonine-protein kinase